MALFIITAAAFLLLTIAVFALPAQLRSLDAFVDRAFLPLRTPRWSRFFAVITFFGGVVGAPLILILLFLVTGFDAGIVRLGAIAVGGSALVAQIVKVLLARVRPERLSWRPEELEYSYPSGHSTSAVSLYGLIAALAAALPYGAVIVALCVVLILSIGLSRIALSVHYATDVLGGFLLGAAFLILAFLV